MLICPSSWAYPFSFGTVIFLVPFPLYNHSHQNRLRRAFCILHSGVDLTNPPTQIKPPSHPPFSTHPSPPGGNNDPCKSYPKDLFASFCLSFPSPFILNVYIEYKENLTSWYLRRGTAPFALVRTFAFPLFLWPLSQILDDILVDFRYFIYITSMVDRLASSLELVNKKKKEKSAE